MQRLRWLVPLLACLLLVAGGLGVPTARAQYTDGLPAGLAQITVDGQAIDASTSPTTASATPQIAGRVTTGATALELAVAPEQKAAIRFPVDVDQRGRFKGQPPTPLSDGTYALYVNDALVGSFVVRGGGTPTPRQGTANLDLAQVVPFPFDFGSAIPNLGFVDGRFYSLQDEAFRTAQASGDTSAQAVTKAQKDLRAAGWQQRYDARLAVPNAADPTRFDVQVSAFAIAYETPQQADAAFRSVVGTAKPIDSVTIGDTSQLDAIKGTAQNTGADYRGLRVTFRQDRVLAMILLADLTNKEPDQAVVEAAALAVQQRLAALLAGSAVGLSPLAQTLDLSESATGVKPAEAYDVLGSAVVGLYGESGEAGAARAATFGGASDAYLGTFTASLVAANEAAPGTPAAAGPPLAYHVGLLAFAADADADAWMQGLSQQLASPPAGYAAFDPVADAPAHGDASATYKIATAGDTPLSGYRIYVRDGSRVAWVELASTSPVALAAVGQIAEDQATCLRKERCSPVPLPALDGSGAAGNPAAGRDRNRGGGTPTPDNGVEVIGG